VAVELALRGQYVVDRDGSNLTLLLGPVPRLGIWDPAWSPDGKYLVHMEQTGPTGAGVWALPAGEKKPISIVQAQTTQSRIVQSRLSPDGRWLAFSSTESGREEVYVTHFPSGQGRWQISQSGGTFPAWRADSKEVYFIGLDGAIHAASVDPNKTEFQLNSVSTLFQVSYISPIGNPYDVSADGQHFVFTTYPQSQSTPMVLVNNWLADLKK
jgi:Tol biopolymer transport system component